MVANGLVMVRQNMDMVLWLGLLSKAVDHELEAFNDLQQMHSGA